MTWKSLSILCLFFISSLSSFAQADLEDKLFLLPDVIFTKIETAPGFVSSYELKVKQPLDHKNPESGSFYQKVYLNHRGTERPNVIVTEGYDRTSNRIYELSGFMGANQVTVEHRYYGKSVPDSMNYSYLNLQQSTDDLHYIRTILGRIYQQPWVSTGISKGGMTTLYYRFFYPEDVSASIPYVAPINLGFKDERIYSFLRNVGTEDCREKIKAFQRHMLEEKEHFMPLLKWWAKGQSYSFNRLGVEAAYELTVLEFSFSFWQLGHSCEAIPSLDQNPDSLLSYFIGVSSIDFFSDQTIDKYKPFYYQMGTEMGYYGYETGDFQGLLDAVDDEPSAVFPPMEAEVVYTPAMTQQMHNWLVQEAGKIVYINGATDTWSATGVRPVSSLDVLVYYLEGKDHRSARIKGMTPAQQKELEAKLESWLKMDIPGYNQNGNKS